MEAEKEAALWLAVEAVVDDDGAGRVCLGDMDLPAWAAGIGRKVAVVLLWSDEVVLLFLFIVMMDDGGGKEHYVCA